MTAQEPRPGHGQVRAVPVTAYQPVPLAHLDVSQATALAETEAATRQRNPAPAYLLCVFLGTLGLHRFYLRRNGSALAMLLITVLTLAAGTLITVPWAIVDLFLISRMIREENAVARRDAYSRYGLAAPAS
jgi:TM2 domain-containing membrane protein YozV